MYYYTSLYKETSSMGYRGNKTDARQDAKKYGMEIQPETEGYFLKSKKIEVIIHEHDSKTKNIERQCDPRPYMLKRRPDFKKVDLTKRLATLVRKLNQGKANFDDVIAAAEEAKKKAAELQV